ncbi:MAG: hypothetical protein AAGD14_14710 [Planctomycetota bacterium]
MKPIKACRWLENKAFMMGPSAEKSPDEDLLDQFSTPCWCSKTHDSLGPDGDDADLKGCIGAKTRDCFESEI